MRSIIRIAGSRLSIRSEEYLNAESTVNREGISDGRIHCCLYFIAPSNYGLKHLDIVEYMRRLHDKVNIIPIIAKADTMIPEEMAHFKKQILSEIAQHEITIYDFPKCTNKEIRYRVPFAVVGSCTVREVDGKKVRGRTYQWGMVQIENLEHCDFIALQGMMTGTHLQDLKDVTNNIFYENYRRRKLNGTEIAKQQYSLNKNLLAQVEAEKREHLLKMKKQVSQSKFEEKEPKMKESEANMVKRKMRNKMDQLYRNE